MFASLFKFNQRTPLHLIVITDDDTRDLFKKILTQNIGKFLSETIMQHTLNRNFPRIRVEFTKLTSITDKYRSDINEMKTLFGFSDPDVKYVIKDEVVLVPNTKYTHDLFFIAPFYHKEVTKAMQSLTKLEGRLAQVEQKVGSQTSALEQKLSALDSRMSSQTATFSNKLETLSGRIPPKDSGMTPEQIAARDKNMTCTICGEKGHRATHCPNK